jgi:peptidoglycan/xylan/chitin deacetylase (PgdA/CDA1 family)
MGVDYHRAVDAPRLTVAVTIDHDAISDSVRRGDPPVKVSHGEFGPRVGAKRLLEMLARRGIPATFFVPGHTLTTFTDDTEAILAGGHELGCHGWFHEDFAELADDQARDVLGRSVEAVRAVTAGAPAGFRAPYWSLGSETLELVEAAGFVYDSSLMADDYHLYRVRHGDRHSTVDGTEWGEPGRLVEAPVYWAMDDWPHFEPGPGRSGLSAPSAVLEIWTEELRYAHEHVPGGLVMITIHPECIGRGHRMTMLERFIDTASTLDGVAFETLGAVVGRWAAANP